MPYKYKVLNLTNKGNSLWTATVEKWQGCYCSKTSKEVEIISDRMPGLKEAKEAYSRY